MLSRRRFSLFWNVWWTLARSRKRIQSCQECRSKIKSSEMFFHKIILHMFGTSQGIKPPPDRVQMLQNDPPPPPPPPPRNIKELRRVLGLFAWFWQFIQHYSEITQPMTFENHLCEKVTKATSIFAAMRRTFKYLDTKSLLVIYKTLVRTHLDYVSSVWAPCKMKCIEKIESVQKRITKQFPGMNISRKIKKIRVTYISLQTNKRGYDWSIQNY